MKKIVTLVVSIMAMMYVHAQDILQDMPLARIVQDSSITRLMVEKRDGITKGQTQVPGWRVQVYSSNQQSKAKMEAEHMADSLRLVIDQPVYVLSQQPFWKVRIGNFMSQEEAAAYREQLLLALPQLQGVAYVVRDEHIQIIQ